MVVDRYAHTVTMSRIFQWYGTDFGQSRVERRRFTAPYLYDEAGRAFLEEHAETVAIQYQAYDWRLNR